MSCNVCSICGIHYHKIKSQKSTAAGLLPRRFFAQKRMICSAQKLKHNCFGILFRKNSYFAEGKICNKICLNNKVTILYLKIYKILCIITLNNGEICFPEAEN